MLEIQKVTTKTKSQMALEFIKTREVELKALPIQQQYLYDLIFRWLPTYHPEDFNTSGFQIPKANEELPEKTYKRSRDPLKYAISPKLAHFKMGGEISRSKAFSFQSNKACNLRIIQITEEYWLKVEEAIFNKYKIRVDRTGAFKKPECSTYRFKTYVKWNINDGEVWDRYHALGYDLTNFLRDKFLEFRDVIAKDLYSTG